MNYLTERKLRWKKAIIDKGVDHNDFEKIYPYMKTRGYFRYKQLIDELRKVKDKSNDTSKITITQINAIYIFDIHFRRELMRLLAPIEVQLKASIQLEHDRVSKNHAYIVVNGIIQSLLNSKFYRELIADKKVKYMKRVASVMRSLEKRKERIEFRGYIDTLMIGELIDLIVISHQRIDFVKRVLTKSTWDGSTEPLVFIENLRNGAFHHNLFGRVSKNKSMKVSNIMTEFMSIVDLFFGKDSKAIESLKRRTVDEINSKPILLKEVDTIKLIYGPFWE